MDEESRTGAPAGIFRRLAALVYDALLVAALLFVATFALLPLSGGEAILTASQGAVGHLYRALLLTLAFAYFGLCWTRGGQTLGMKAWRIRLQARDGFAPAWPAALLRFAIGAAIVLIALAGVFSLRGPGWSPRGLAALLMVLPAIANWLWIAVDGKSRSLLDLAVGTRVMQR